MPQHDLAYYAKRMRRVNRIYRWFIALDVLAGLAIVFFT